MTFTHRSTSPLLIIIAALFTFFISNSFAQTQGKLEIKNPWVREAPPHAAVLGAYMSIENHSGKDVKLVHISSSDFGHVEMHRSVEKDGMMSMVKQSSISIPAGKKFQFKPGAYHLMLMKPKRALKAGDKVSLTLKFADGIKLDISAPVKKDMGGGMDMNHGSSHDMHEMKH